MTLRLFRVVVPVEDIERGAAFYATLLGDAGERVLETRHYFDVGGTIVALVNPRGHDRPFRPNPDYLYFAVVDLEAAFARAQAAGCSGLESGITKQVWGERSFYVRDPFGNPLSFVDQATLYTGGPWPQRSS